MTIDQRTPGSGTPPADDALRDARLARALEHAPDAHMTPDAAVRQAVLRAAREAVAPATAAPASASPARRSLWAWLMGEDGGRTPWNAAFATLLVAGIVALLWHDQPVPDARPDAQGPATSKVAPAAAPAPAPAAQAPAASPAPTAPAAAERRSTARDAPSVASPATSARKPESGVAAEVQRDRAEASMADTSQSESARKAANQELEASRARREAPAIADAARPATVPGTAGASGSAMREDALSTPRAPMAVPAPSPAPAPPVVAQAAPAPSVEAAPAARATAEAAPAPRAAAAASRLVAPPAWPQQWTALRIAARAAPLARGDSGALPQLLAGLRRAAPATDASASGNVAAAPALQLELFEGERRLGVLEVFSGRARWQPTGGATADYALDTTTEATLRAEVARLTR